MKKQMLAVVASMATMAVIGDVVTNSVNNGISDWTLPGSYSNNRVPQANDVVEIPDGYTVTVNSASSLEVVSRLWQVRPMGETSTIIFDFASGEVTNNSAITYGDTSGLGKIVKRGAGKVVFTAHNRFGNTLQKGTDYLNESSYLTGGIDVECGWLIMPQMVTKHQFYYGSVTVANGAAFALPTYDKNHPGGSSSCYSALAELGGYGMITNLTSDVSMEMRPQSGDFYGKIGGKVTLYVTGRINLHGTENTVPGDIKPAANSSGRPGSTGTIGVASFGMQGAAKSSLGKQNYQYVAASGGGFVYLGEGETTDKSLGIDSKSAKGGMFIDGGQHGNLQFTGKFVVQNEASGNRQTLYLYGTNDIGECVVNCQMATNLYVCKRGPGTWRLADFVSNSYGASLWCDSLAVEEGTLKFDSLAEAGTRCSLGYGTRKRLPYWGAYDSSKDRPYSISLGGDLAANATLQYNGTEQNVASTRPIAVTGTGTLKGHGQSGGILGIANVWAADGETGTLVLDGEAGTTNFIANVADSNGVLNIVKKGGGFWRLSGDVDITGDIRAEGGTLEVENIPANATYNWYRVTIRELNTYAQGSGERSLFQLQEFAFYDANGNRQGLNATYIKPTAEDLVSGKVYKNRSDYLRLEPGTCSRANTGYGNYQNLSARTLEQIFNDGAPTAGNADYSFVQEGSCGSGTTTLQINRNNPDSFYRFVVHLANDTPPIVSYDMARYRGNVPVCWTIEASTDGLVWDEVAKVDDYTCPASVDGYTQGYWISNGKMFVKSEVRPYSSGCGFSLSASHNSRPGMLASRIRAVGASAGGTLRFTGSPVEVNGLVANAGANSSGVIENATYAASGTLYLEEVIPHGVTAVSANMRLADAATRANVAGWSVVAGGRQRGYRIVVGADGEVSVVKHGFILTYK